MAHPGYDIRPEAVDAVLVGYDAELIFCHFDFRQTHSVEQIIKLAQRELKDSKIVEIVQEGYSTTFVFENRNRLVFDSFECLSTVNED